MIALPLQRKPRQIDNSLFLDDKPSPYEEHWAFPSEVRRFSRPAQLVQVSSLWVSKRADCNIMLMKNFR